MKADNDIIVEELIGKVSAMEIQLQNKQKEHEVLANKIKNMETQMREKDSDNEQFTEEVETLRNLLQELFEELPEDEKISFKPFAEAKDIESIHPRSKTESNVEPLGVYKVRYKY